MPLLQVLAALASYRPLSSIIFKFEAVLVPAALLQLRLSWLKYAYPCVLQRYQVEVLVLGTSGILLVVVQLLTQEDELALLEGMVVQGLLVEVAFTFI